MVHGRIGLPTGGLLSDHALRKTVRGLALIVAGVFFQKHMESVIEAHDEDGVIKWDAYAPVLFIVLDEIHDHVLRVSVSLWHRWWLSSFFRFDSTFTLETWRSSYQDGRSRVGGTIRSAAKKVTASLYVSLHY